MISGDAPTREPARAERRRGGDHRERRTGVGALRRANIRCRRGRSRAPRQPSARLRRDRDAATAWPGRELYDVLAATRRASTATRRAARGGPRRRPRRRAPGRRPPASTRSTRCTRRASTATRPACRRIYPTFPDGPRSASERSDTGLSHALLSSASLGSSADLMMDAPISGDRSVIMARRLRTSV
jgi:hypothetical protein